jgi:hypothetical protein
VKAGVARVKQLQKRYDGPHTFEFVRFKKGHIGVDDLDEIERNAQNRRKFIG